jgi:hypothetical protein
MSPKLIQLLAVVATVLVVATGVTRLMRPTPAEQPTTQKKKSVASNTTKPDPPCTIKRASFGGTQASLLKVMKGQVAHYVVLDHPGNNPMMPFYQRDWLEATYGPVQPVLVGDFSSVDGAIMRAASLCKRN